MGEPAGEKTGARSMGLERRGDEWRGRTGGRAAGTSSIFGTGSCWSGRAVLHRAHRGPVTTTLIRLSLVVRATQDRIPMALVPVEAPVTSSAEWRSAPGRALGGSDAHRDKTQPVTRPAAGRQPAGRQETTGRSGIHRSSGDRPAAGSADPSPDRDGAVADRIRDDVPAMAIDAGGPSRRITMRARQLSETRATRDEMSGPHHRGKYSCCGPRTNADRRHRSTAEATAGRSSARAEAQATPTSRTSPRSSARPRFPPIAARP